MVYLKEAEHPAGSFNVGPSLSLGTPSNNWGSYAYKYQHILLIMITTVILEKSKHGPSRRAPKPPRARGLDLTKVKGDGLGSARTPKLTQIMVVPQNFVYPQYAHYGSFPKFWVPQYRPQHIIVLIIETPKRYP